MELQFVMGKTKISKSSNLICCPVFFFVVFVVVRYILSPNVHIMHVNENRINASNVLYSTLNCTWLPLVSIRQFYSFSDSRQRKIQFFSPLFSIRCCIHISSISRLIHMVHIRLLIYAQTKYILYYIHGRKCLCSYVASKMDS